jgi:hypothetical protein
MQLRIMINAAENLGQLRDEADEAENHGLSS